jgi:hypothetical protein
MTTKTYIAKTIDDILEYYIFNPSGSANYSTLFVRNNMLISYALPIATYAKDTNTFYVTQQKVSQTTNRHIILLKAKIIEKRLKIKLYRFCYVLT